MTPDASCDQAMPCPAPVFATHRAALSLFEAVAYFLIAVVIDIVLGLYALGDVLAGSLLNPDSYMRLVRLHDILAQHVPLDVVARDGSGDGTVLPWSHLLDALILVLSAPLRAMMSGPQALHWTAVALGPIGIGLLGVALAWVLAPLTSRAWRWTAPVSAATSLFIVGYGLSGVVHHHVLVAFTITMTVGYAVRAGAAGERAGWLMGFWAGAGLWLTPETMPFTIATYGGVGLAWLLQPSRSEYGRALLVGGCGFLLLVCAAVAIDPPHGGYGDTEIDRISIVYVVLATVVFAIGWSTWQLDRWCLPAGRRAAIGIAVVVAGLGLWLALFPAVAKGPDGLMDAQQAKAFFGAISEMEPVKSFRDAWRGLLDGMLAVSVLLAITARTRSPLWAYGAIAGSLTVVLGFMHLRFLTYPATLAAGTLPLAMTCGERWLAQLPAQVQSAARVTGLGLFLAAPYAIDTANALSSGAASPQDAEPSCSVRLLGPLLAPYAGQVVMADVNDSPELLYRTELRTVGSLYHTHVAAFMRLRAAWRSAPSEHVPEAVRATRASLLLFCPHTSRSALVADLPPNTLWDRLNRGEPPVWLEEIGEDPRSGHVLYRIGEPRDEAASVGRH